MRAITQRRPLSQTIAGSAGLRGYGLGDLPKSSSTPSTSEVATLIGQLPAQAFNLTSARTSTAYTAARNTLSTTLTRARTLLGRARPAGVTEVQWAMLSNAYNAAQRIYLNTAAPTGGASAGSGSPGATPGAAASGSDPQKAGGTPAASGGSRGDPAVTQLQTLLRQDGYNPGTIDGAWGPNTSNALQRAVSAMGIAAATARYGAANIARLGTSLDTTGGGPPVEDEGGLFSGVTRWITGIFGGGTDQAAGAAGQITAAVEDVATTAATAAGTAAGREAASNLQQRIGEVVGNPLFLVGVGVLGVGIAMALLPKKGKGKGKGKAKK